MPSFQPSKYEDFACIFHKCREDKNSNLAVCLHAYMCGNAPEAHTSLGNSLVPMLVEIGSTNLAQQVFDKLESRDTHSWNSLIAGYVKIGESQQALNLYHKMQQDDSVYPTKEVFVALLKACTVLRDLERGHIILSEIARLGLLQKDVFVGSTAVNMYGKCGCLAKAQEIFDHLSWRNVVLWNALITGYVEHGCSEEALTCYRQMQNEGISPSGVSLVCMLKACTTMGFTVVGQEIHALIIKKGLLGETIIGSALVDMYAKCGSLTEAQEVFEKLPVKDTVLWNVMIAGYVEQGRGWEALVCFERMQEDGALPDSVTVVCSLKACSSIGAITKGHEIHADIAKKGFMEGDAFVGSTLVDMFAKCGCLAAAQNIFNKLFNRDLISYNALIAGYAEQGHCDKALDCFEQMNYDGISRDSITYVCGLKACCSLGIIEKIRKIHIEIAKKGLERFPFVVYTLLTVYSKSGLISEAQEVFGKPLYGLTVSWNALIVAYAKYGHFDEALNCLKKMETRGNYPDTDTLIWSLKVCGSIGDAESGQRIHIEVTRKGLFETDELVGSSLIDMYAKCGLLADTQKVFADLSVQDVVSWTALISGFVDCGCADEALHLFEQMQHQYISPSPLTFVCCLKACSSIGTADKGQKLHMESVRTGFLERSTFIVSSLIFMYAQCGLLREAQEVFNHLPNQDSVLWTVVISGYVEHGRSEEALNLLEQMQQAGVYLSIVTYIYSLKACGNIGDTNRAQEIYIDLVKKGFETDPSVGSTMVDLFSKCGALAEAKEVFDNLPVYNATSWIALIVGCVKHGSCEEALNHFEQMQQQGFSLCADAFIHGLRACTDLGATLKGREIHAEIARKGMERELLVGNTMVNMYAKCGLLAEARDLFDKLPCRDVVSWTVLIAGYAEHGVYQEALRCFEQMQAEDVIPVVLTFICCLKACCSDGATGKGQELHSELAKKGLETEFLIGSTLVSMYAKWGLLAEAHQVFDQLPIQKVDSWNALITGYAEHGHVEKGLGCIEQMQCKGMYPDVRTLSRSLKACSITGSTLKVFELHAGIVRMGLEKELYIGNALVDTYAKCGLLVDTQEVFDKLLVRDVSTWTAVITGFAQLGKCENALHVFERMLAEGERPSSITFISVLNACCHAGLVDEGLVYFQAINNHCGLVPTLGHYTIMVDLLGRAGHTEMAAMLCKRMPIQPGTVVWHTLLGACKKWGNVDLGRQTFEQAVCLDEADDAAYVYMSNLFADVAMQEDEPG